MHGRLQCQPVHTQPLNSIMVALTTYVLTAGLLGLGRGCGISVAVALDGQEGHPKWRGEETTIDPAALLLSTTAVDLSRSGLHPSFGRIFAVLGSAEIVGSVQYHKG